MIWAIILAAGESKRMGESKLLLPFGRESIIEKVIENVIRSSIDRIMVVLGAERQKIQEKMKRFPVETTVNTDFKKGMLSSIQRGFQSLPRNAEAALVILGDQPRISTKTINRVLEAFRKERKGIVLPVFHNTGGHPLLVDMKYRIEIQALNPKIGLRELLSLHPEDILRVEVEDPFILKDIDRPEDYKEQSEKS
ncbi:MAG: nucleotidyltransferase family protein [Candidatus Aminicenantales bacterium]